MSLSNELVWKQVSSTIEYFKGKKICIDKEKCLNQFVDLKKFNKDHLSKEIVTKKWLQYFKTIIVPDKYWLSSKLSGQIQLAITREMLKELIPKFF